MSKKVTSGATGASSTEGLRNRSSWVRRKSFVTLLSGVSSIEWSILADTYQELLDFIKTVLNIPHLPLQFRVAGIGEFAILE